MWPDVPTLAGLSAAASTLAVFGMVYGALRTRPPRTAPGDGPVHPGRRAARRRTGRVEREVPQLLDLLAAGSTAGLSAELSLRRASEALRGPLGEDIRNVAHLADLGARWRDELDTYAEATGSIDLKRAVAVLRRTEDLGASLAEATRELAATVRHARRTATLERARTAPVKMLFPLVFLILPAFLLLTVVPVLLTTVRSIR
jgi:tight adherence protein C